MNTFDTTYRGWQFTISDLITGKAIFADFGFECEQDAEDEAMLYVQKNNLTQYHIDVEQAQDI